MSFKPKRKTSIFACFATVAFYNFQLCSSMSVAESKDFYVFPADPGEISRTHGSENNPKRVGDRVALRRAPLPGFGRPGRPQHRPIPTVSAARSPTHGGIPTSEGIDEIVPQKIPKFPWSVGHVVLQRRPRASESEAGYQADFSGADFSGFHGVQGIVSGPPFDTEWQALRPFLQCDGHIMTFTVSGQGHSRLFVDGEGASPIPVFQLPPMCSYTVSTSRNDLVIMAASDGCFTQENDSYVVPLWWWDRPLNLSCPMQKPTLPPSPSHPTLSDPQILCSPYGMEVHVYAKEEDLQTLGAIVNSGRSPFVSVECAYHLDSQPGKLIFFIPFIPFPAPCLTVEDGVHLHFLFNQWESTLSCPDYSHVSHLPSSPYFPHYPGESQYSYSPDPVLSTRTRTHRSPPLQPPTQQQLVQLPDFLHYLYPGLLYPQAYLPGPHPAHPPRPTLAGLPGSQSQQLLYPMGPDQLTYFPGEPSNYPSPPQQSAAKPTPAPTPNPMIEQHKPKLPVGPGQYQLDLHYPEFYYPHVKPATTSTTEKPPSFTPYKLPSAPYYHHYPHLFHYGSHSSAPDAQKTLNNPYYEYGSVYHQGSSSDVPPFYQTQPPTTTRTMIPNQPVVPHHYSSGSYYQHGPVFFPPPGLLDPSVPPAQLLAICHPYAHTICSYYPSPYYQHPYQPNYSPFYPPAHPPPRPATTTTPHTSTPSPLMPPPKLPPKQPPSLQCFEASMVAFLPHAHPDSIQLRGEETTWQFLSNVSVVCRYMVRRAKESGVTFHSPLPACHSLQRSPAKSSLPLRFWDLTLGQYRSLELECPHQPPPVSTPAPPASTTHAPIPTFPVPKPKIACFTLHMTVELPPGPISEMVIKDIQGNQVNFNDAPKHCRYSASQIKDGRIILNFPYIPNCYVTRKDREHIIIVVYMTVEGRREDQLSCPIALPESGHECNISSEQRLPCGSGSVSQSGCLSMGCCVSKQAPACYYPMDECTLDRHFVFSVPASLTEPPLSPALLVGAGNSSCKPQKVTSNYALFKIPMDSCGTRRVMLGKSLVYIVEIVNQIQSITLNYGTITRDSPVRLLVECRYLPGAVATVGYMVKSPSLGSDIHAHGVIGVQLRIAKDDQYSSYYPQYHQPLQMLLGKPLYLEVRLINPPDSNLKLLVHYCVAYPRSGEAVWVLLYNGCPNPLDPAAPQTILSSPQPPASQSQTHRFTITTFQFLQEEKTSTALDEEVYFMCSTEVCLPQDGPCVEGCFGQ